MNKHRRYRDSRGRLWIIPNDPMKKPVLMYERRIKLFMKIAVALGLIALLAFKALAQSGDPVLLKGIGSAAVATGAGASNSGTIRVIAASDSPSGSITFPAGALPVISTSPITTIGRSGAPQIISTTLTSGSTSYTGSLSGIRVFAQAADATFNIAMSSAATVAGQTSPTITVRNGVGIDIELDYLVTSATVTWLSGTIDVMMEGSK